MPFSARAQVICLKSADLCDSRFVLAVMEKNYRLADWRADAFDSATSECTQRTAGKHTPPCHRPLSRSHTLARSGQQSLAYLVICLFFTVNGLDVTTCRQLTYLVNWGAQCYPNPVNVTAIGFTPYLTSISFSKLILTKSSEKGISP